MKKTSALTWVHRARRVVTALLFAELFSLVYLVAFFALLYVVRVEDMLFFHRLGFYLNMGLAFYFARYFAELASLEASLKRRLSLAAVAAFVVGTLAGCVLTVGYPGLWTAVLAGVAEIHVVEASIYVGVPFALMTVFILWSSKKNGVVHGCESSGQHFMHRSYISDR